MHEQYLCIGVSERGDVCEPQVRLSARIQGSRLSARRQRMPRRVALFAEMREHVRQLQVLVSRGPGAPGRPVDVRAAKGRHGRLDRTGRRQPAAGAQGTQEEPSSRASATHPARQAAVETGYVSSVRQGRGSALLFARWRQQSLIRTALVAHRLCTDAADNSRQVEFSYQNNMCFCY